MSIISIVGALIGDEGKGKFVDYFAKDADMVIRYQGGGNAGHSVITDKGKFAFHLMPSGALHENIQNVLTAGVAFNYKTFFKEYDELVGRGIVPKIAISDRIQLLMPYHIIINQYEEEHLSNFKFGSTGTGITPFYSDYINKRGILATDLNDGNLLYHKISNALEYHNAIIQNVYKKEPIKATSIYPDVMKYKERIKSFLCDTRVLINQYINNGYNIILEGQLGTIRDLYHGIYPHITSSSTLSSFGLVSCGIGHKNLDDVIGIVKSYISSVGSGPFPTELFGDEASRLREINGEYGTTTGRPRRVGWFDCVMARYGLQTQGATKTVLTLLDVLSEYEIIPVCTNYIDPSRKFDYKNFPTTDILGKVQPYYEHINGWHTPITGINKWEDLPKKCKNYVEFIEDHIGYRFDYISTGKHRDNVIIR